MYNLCCVLKPFQGFLHFLWFIDNNLSGKTVHCWMTRLAYGLLCSQSGAKFCLRKTILSNEVDVSSETVDLALDSFYVEDFLTSVASTADLETLHHEIKTLLDSGGFQICKFGPNCKDLHAAIPLDDLAPSFVP